MKNLIASLALVMAITACSDKNPFVQEWNTPYGTAPFSKISEADYKPAILKGIKERAAEIEAIVSNPEAPTFENTIAAYELSGELLSKTVGVFYNISESDATPSIQALVDELTPVLTAAEDEVFMNKAFFERVKAVYENSSELTREQQMVTKKLYENFVRNGIALDEAGQARFKEINSALASLSQKFANNLLAENNAFKAETGVTVSAYPDFMTSCADRAAREKAFKAYSSRGNNGNDNDNNAIVLEIMKLRTEQANLLGYKTSADYLLANKMAGNPETVDKFLGEIMASAMKKAKEEIYDMQKVMDEDVKAGLLPAGSKIQPWDWFYYAEKVRSRKYDLDEDLTKPYFQVDSVRKGVFYAANKIYGVNVEEAPEVEVYNPDVKAYKLTDADGSLLGIFYADYFSRETKRGGAWMNNFRDQYVKADGYDVRPVIVNVCNFPPATEETPSLLSIDNVQTAFHEFGHALHGFLTKCNYRDVSGTSVTRDFVEMFSQFNEHWAFQKEILAHYANDYRTGEPIPEDLVAKIGNALKFNQGFMTGELCAASILDMKWHELTAEELAGFTDAQSIRDFETKVCKEMGLIDEIIPRYRTTYFNHIFNSGYSAGYYSYLWSEVLDCDAFEYFEKNGIYDKSIADRFRRTFLERGGSEEPMTLFLEFRGQEPDPGALLRKRGLE
ncbi:MAG: M3 family metallopeptidase [Bacteroidales bacterium]|nr:M3 family metallopeptidase [Bacteroidales bacterium]MBQ5528269.1 M3 family metallopeptidase [Bacteroidales bacterium]